MPDTPPTLAYGRQTRALHRRRSIWIAVAVIVVVMAAARPVYLYVQPQIAQRKYLQQQRDLSRPVRVPTDIIYSDDPNQVSSLRSSDYGTSPYFRYSNGSGRKIDQEDWPTAIADQGFDNFTTSMGVVPLYRAFRGTLISADGTVRIVAGHVFPTVMRVRSLRIIDLSGMILVPANSTPGSVAPATYAVFGSLVMVKEDRLTLFAGQFDENDRTRIFFDYIFNGESGVLETRLQPDGKFRMTAVSGKLGVIDPDLSSRLKANR